MDTSVWSLECLSMRDWLDTPRRLLILGSLLTVVGLFGLGMSVALIGSQRAGPLIGLQTDSVAAAFDRAPACPGYQWARNGWKVPWQELITCAGPRHCSWESATFLNIGWPLGTRATHADQARVYIRDPSDVVGYQSRLIRNATLPHDARPTGYKLGSIQIYFSPSDQDEAVYLVAPSGSERWPRSDPMTGCM
jgi:hypothetical protein